VIPIYGCSTIAVLGLGEAGSAFASALVAAGGPVRGFDPITTVPPGVVNCLDEADAVSTAGLILSVNTARTAFSVFQAAADHVSVGAVWADMNTTEPTLKRRLSALASERGVVFADIAIMTSVPGRGLATPLLASGEGARRAAMLLGAYGACVEVLDEPAGAASQRKLLRSVFYKGMAAAVVEALAAARALGLDCGPMSGFDNQGVDKEFFAGTQIKSYFLCNLGFGVPGSVRPRAARLGFDEACKIL